jgi:hypothetical protein
MNLSWSSETNKSDGPREDSDHVFVPHPPNWRDGGRAKKALRCDAGFEQNYGVVRLGLIENTHLWELGKDNWNTSDPSPQFEPNNKTNSHNNLFIETTYIYEGMQRLGIPIEYSNIRPLLNIRIFEYWKLYSNITRNNCILWRRVQIDTRDAFHARNWSTRSARCDPTLWDTTLQPSLIGRRSAESRDSYSNMPKRSQSNFT